MITSSNPRKSVFLSLFLAQMERWLHKAKESSALSSNQDCVLTRTLVTPSSLESRNSGEPKQSSTQSLLRTLHKTSENFHCWSTFKHTDKQLSPGGVEQKWINNLLINIHTNCTFVKLYNNYLAEFWLYYWNIFFSRVLTKFGGFVTNFGV